MEEANSTKAEYLFQPDKYYDASYDIGEMKTSFASKFYNTGSKIVQHVCGVKSDCLLVREKERQTDTCYWWIW